MTKGSRNVFISHVHEDDALLPKMKDLIRRAGMEVRDGSVNSDKPNNAKSEAYIKSNILAPRIDWSSVLIVLISKDTASSDWVNWEIEYAVQQGKKVIGVYAQGATQEDMPEALEKLGDAAVVGWQGQRIIDAIEDDARQWQDPKTEEPREPEWEMKHHGC